MRKHIVTLVAIVMFLFSAGLVIGAAHAGTADAVTAVDTRTAPGGGGVSSVYFDLGDTVYIYWGPVAPVGATVDVVVYGPDGSLQAMWLNQPPSASGTPALSFSVGQLGNYDVTFNGQRDSITRTIASVSLFAVPESVLGTLMTIIAGVGALCVFRFSSKKRLKPSGQRIS